MNPKLPDWALVALVETAKGAARQAPFYEDQRTLAKMPDRPGNACCP